MSTKKRKALILVLALVAGVALVTGTWAAPGAAPGAMSGAAPMAGGAPTVVAYQGEVRVSGVPYNGEGYFKFAIMDAGTTLPVVRWTNDGTGFTGEPPTSAVQLAVTDGLFSVLLGDTNLGGMTEPLPASVFGDPDRRLWVWFSTSSGGTFSLLGGTRIAAVPYALQAERVRGYAGVVVVAKSGGDHTSVQTAIDWITDASAANPYLVWVAPGEYVEQVTMKPHVHLQGAGQEATVIHSTASTGWPITEATLKLASDTSLRDLTVSNGGTGDRNVALMAPAGTEGTMVADVTARAQGGSTISNYGLYLEGSGTDVMLQEVTALAENSTSSNYGLWVRGGVAATLHGGSFIARGGTNARGIYNYEGALEAHDVRALAEDASSDNYGLSRDYGAVTLRGGTFTGRGGTSARGLSSKHGTTTLLEAEGVIALGEDGSGWNYGLYNEDGASARLHGGSFTGRGGTNALGIHNQDSGTMLEAESVTALGEGASSSNRGLGNALSATSEVTQSVLEGAGNSVIRGGGSVTVSHSRLVGGAVSGTVTCVAVSRGGTFNASGCP